MMLVLLSSSRASRACNASGSRHLDSLHGNSTMLSVSKSDKSFKCRDQ